ncbi:hypothetical protein [Comamonas sp. C24C]
MRGHQPILDMRRCGYAPSSAVFVSDTECPMEAWNARNWHGLANDPLPTVLIEAADALEQLDFRFAVGLPVSLMCLRGEERAKRLFAAIRRAGPSVLACSMGNEVWVFKKEEGGNGKRIRA